MSSSSARVVGGQGPSSLYIGDEPQRLGKIATNRAKNCQNLSRQNQNRAAPAKTEQVPSDLLLRMVVTGLGYLDLLGPFSWLRAGIP
jgi:hypothetical protein